MKNKEPKGEYLDRRFMFETSLSVLAILVHLSDMCNVKDEQARMTLRALELMQIQRAYSKEYFPEEYKRNASGQKMP